jgi:hypothetical protein
MKPPEQNKKNQKETRSPKEMGRPPLFPDDPEIAGDLKDLLQELEIFDSVRPSNRVGTVVRARALRRERRMDRNFGIWTLLWNLELGLKRSALLRLGLGLVVLVGAFLFFLSLFSSPFNGRGMPWDETGGLGPKPAQVAVRWEENEVLPKKPLESLAWIHSNNDLRMLRFLLRRRTGLGYSMSGSRSSAYDARSRRRIEVLAQMLIKFLEQEENPGGNKVHPSYGKVEEASLALKALLASGSTTRRGPHAAWVRKLLKRIESWLPQLHGGSLAVALGAYLEGALITNGRRISVLSREVSRFTEEQARGQQARQKKNPKESSAGGGSDLLGGWSSPLNALAEAGLLLRLAPALSASPEAASRVRQVFLQHLILRTHSKGSKGVNARAALLFGYGDLVDPGPIRKGLAFFERNPDLLGTDRPTLYHLSWSLFPPKQGWARFESALRKLIAGATPSSLREASVLLLAQTVYLAPYLGGR